MRIFTYLIIALFFINISCKSKKESTKKPSTSIDMTKEQLFLPKHTKILEGSHSNVTKEAYQIITSKEALQEVYAIINKTRRPGYSIPKIDFSKETVIGLFMGSKTSGGYAISIDHIDFKPDETLVNIVKKKPSCMATSVMTQPFYIAKIPKTDTKIVFADLSNSH